MNNYSSNYELYMLIVIFVPKFIFAMKITVSEDYKEIKGFQRFNRLKSENGLDLLKESIESFLVCKVEFYPKPINIAKENFNIELHKNPSRGAYPVNSDSFFIYARIIESNKLISGLGILLSGKNISSYTNILNSLEGAITGELSQSFLNYFDDCSLRFGDNIILHTICNHCVRGYINYKKFYHLIEYFLKLKNTTFESNFFSTGLIVTDSFHSYKKIAGEKRYGTLYPLLNEVKISNTFKINRRFWYLADGKHTFYVANKNLIIRDMFVVDDDYSQLDYLDNNSLRLTIKGGDILLRIENEKQFSIINTDGTEFLCLENRWKLRDYNVVKKVMATVIKNIDVIDMLLFFILYCSKNSISSVIWIPNDITIIKDYVKKDTLNKLIEGGISIMDKRFTNHIMRYLSSDGATIIDKDGILQFYGSIVDLSNLQVKGVIGTGESAAQVLSSNGLGIKISQDNTIKLFINNEEEAIIL